MEDNIILNEYNYEIEHRKGKRNNVTDFFSRIKNHAIKYNEEAQNASVYSAEKNLNDNKGGNCR